MASPQREQGADQLDGEAAGAAAAAAGGAEAPAPVQLPAWHPPTAASSLGDFFTMSHPLRVRNSFTRSKVPFIPMNGRRVLWYACGPTVYDDAHLGHARTYASFDTIRRVMESYFGYEVFYVMNITDIDDKIITRSQERDIPFAELARTYERSFLADMDSLGIKAPDAMTRVSEYVPEVIDFISKIIENGYAYESNGSVYFDTVSYSAARTYGKLLPENVGNEKELEEGEGKLSAGTQDKRNACDFALWKASKPGEPTWSSPWGEGRPGWHIECSAMGSSALQSLSKGCMDIHSGGIDLRFPHHENEIAQSEACLGCKQWVQYFLHSGHLHIEGLKMSKSLKNFIKIKGCVERYGARAIRLLFLAHKYNEPMDWSEGRMAQMVALDGKFRQLFMNVRTLLREANAADEAGGGEAPSRHWGPEEHALRARLFESQEAVRAAFCDDFDTPSVLRELERLKDAVNKYIDGARRAAAGGAEAGFGGHGPNPELVRSAVEHIGHIFSVMGVETADPLSYGAAAGAGGDRATVLAPVMDALAAFRRTVREAAQRGDTAAVLAACDRVRDEQLPSAGVKLEDLADRSTWKLGDPAELAAEVAAREAGAAQKAADKAARQAAAAAEAAAREALVSIPPEEFYLRAPEYAGKYSAVDAEGLPTMTADGQELDKKERKKLGKPLKNHRKKYEKWLAKQGGAAAAGGGAQA